MNSVPNEFQLRTQGERILEKHRNSRLIAFHAPLGYRGPSEIKVGGLAFQVVEVQSSLDFHRWAAHSEQHQQPTIVLCPQRDWLTQDLQDRLPDRDLTTLDPWESVKRLFGAEDIEYSLKRERKLAEWLVTLNVSDIRKAHAGIVTTELAWDTLLLKLGLSKDCYDPIELMRQLSIPITKAPANEEVVAELCPSELRLQAREWLKRQGGPEVDQLLELFFRLGPKDTLALCLVLEVIFAAPAGELPLIAQGSLERFLEGRRLDPTIGSRLGELFARFVKTSPQRPWLPPVQTRALEMLHQIHAMELAQYSTILPAGWDCRLVQAFARLDQETKFQDHLLYQPDHEDLLVLQMARRVQAFLSAPSPTPSGKLASWVSHYTREICWLDQAVQWLLHPHPVIQETCTRLIHAASDWRKSYDKGFGSSLADGSAALTGPLVGVEDFIDRILTPLVQPEHSRVLLVVLDGCSQSVLLDLLESADSQNWSHYNSDLAENRHLVAGLPSVTEVSRTSLLSGRLCQGDAGDELKNFISHAGLRQACTVSGAQDYGPRLFHKKNVDQAILLTSQSDYKLVAVVINSIDDTLAKEEQLKLRWSEEPIGPLQQLLQAARIAQRQVLLVSDHGHVLDCTRGNHQANTGTRELDPVAGGDRWRRTSPKGAVAEGTIHFSDGRLLLADSANLAYDQSIHYGPRRRGYHGGCSPAEVVCALALIAQPGLSIPGWKEGRRPAPSWWTGLEAGTASLSQASDLLFSDPLSHRLLKKGVLRNRKSENQPPYLEQVIDLLDDGKVITRAQLATSLGLTSSQLQLRLPQWERWLNTDGLLLLRSDYRQVWLDRLAIDQLLESIP